MPSRVLIADDDSFATRLLEKYLVLSGYEVFKASDGRSALQMVLEHEPSIVITDWSMPQMDGIELCRALRTHEGIGSVYIVMVTAHSDTERLVEAFEAGADEFLAKPINRQKLTARLRAAERIIQLENDLVKRKREIHRLNAEMAIANQQLAQANDMLREMATTDELTGLMNRHEAMNRLDQLWKLWSRYGRIFSTVMIDIDCFKPINDTYGHAAGDDVLKSVAKIIRDSVRTSDLVCRIGGEEFLVICTESNLDAGATCAEHIRAAVADHTFSTQGAELAVTVSLGVAQVRPDMTCPDALLCAADMALYASKNAGRNRVTTDPNRTDFNTQPVPAGATPIAQAITGQMIGSFASR